MSIRRVVALAALALSIALLVTAIRWTPEPEVKPGPTTGLKIIVVGIDGMDWFLTGQLIQQGKMPALTSMMRRSATGQVAADVPALPEAGWTILARGRGMTDIELARLAEGPEGALRGVVPGLAEIVERAGGSAAVVGWPAVWPVETSSATLAAPFAPSSSAHETRLAPALFAGGPGQASSNEVERAIETLVERNEAICEDEFRRRIFDGGPGEGMWEDHLVAARWALLSDLVTADLAASIIVDEAPDLSLICLSGLDVIGHRFVAPAMPDFFPDVPESYGEYADVLDNYYAFMDDVIERFRRLMDEDTVLIVCSVYGTHPALTVPGISGAHSEGPPGVLIVRGRNFMRPSTAIPLTTADFAPTILALLGLEIPTDMDGRALTEMFPRGFEDRHPLVYGGRSPDVSSEDRPAEGQETMRNLVERRLDSLRAGMN